MTFALLYILGTIDAAMSGYRDAAGRNALIGKRRYYMKAMLRGAMAGQLIMIAAAVILALLLLQSSERDLLLDDMRRFGERMLIIYLPYSAIISFALAMRAMPSVDIRSLASVLFFGPLLLFRPVAALAGVIYGAMVVQRPAITVINLAVVIMMLSVEKLFGLFRGRRMLEKHG